MRSNKVIWTWPRVAKLACVVVLSVSACSHRPPPRLGTPALRSMKVYLPAKASFAADGPELPKGLEQRFRDAVHAHLRQAGVAVISQSGAPADAALNLEGRLKVAGNVVQGAVWVTVWGGPGVVDQLRWEIAKPMAAFLQETSYQVVTDTMNSPRVVAFANQRVTPQAAPPLPVTQPVASPARTREQAIADARVHSDNAGSLYKVGRYADAIIEYQQAYADMPDAVLLFDIAQCQRKLGHRREAIDMYRRYLADAPDAKNRADVDKRIDELEREEEHGK